MAIALIATATVLVFAGAAIRVRSDGQPRSSISDSAAVVKGIASSATSLAGSAVAPPPLERVGNGTAGAVAGFGLFVVWLIFGLLMVARSRGTRQQFVGTPK